MKNQNTLFSIITVSFNAVNSIEKTINSVLIQTYRNIEYIIIDGGSIDGTVDIIKKYNDKIAYWVSEKDNGISDAFNKGILVSKGSIIGIINSDDWYEPNTVEMIYELDNENNADFYVGALRYWHNIKNSFIAYPDQKYKCKISYHMPHLNHPASFFKKEVYDDIGGFNIKYKYAMDYDLFLRAVLKNKKGFLTNEVLANMLAGGVTTLNEKKVWWENVLISQNKILGILWYLYSLLKIMIRKVILGVGGSQLLFSLKLKIYDKGTKRNNSKTNI